VPTLPHREFVWLVMAMSSTFAGNLSLLGSMANLIVAERAESRGVRVGFRDYLVVGIPVTLLTIAWGIIGLVLLVRRP
jgi:Na+/H+ antiporter NhaD/arsenite permease-like protein